MLEPITPKARVRVQRHQDTEPFEADTVLALYMDVRNPERPDDPPKKGKLLGILWRDNRGFEGYAQPNQIERVQA